MSSNKKFEKNIFKEISKKFLIVLLDADTNAP